jgi:aspartate/glutamate racemase
VARIINMPEVAMKKCLKRYGVICSRFSHNQSIYSGYQTNDEEQEMTDRIIENAISGKTETKDLTDLYKIIKGLISRGAEEVILGCTELSLLADLIPSKTFEGYEIIDASKEAIKELFNG